MRNRRDSSNPGNKPTVVIVHGLWLSGHAMKLLAFHLRRLGFEPVTITYHSVSADLNENAARLKKVIAAMGAREIHLVGHSMGGVLALKALADYPELSVARVVLVGTPYRDCHAAKILSQSKLGYRAIGRSMRQWLDAPKEPWRGAQELGVIAGSLPMGLGQLIPGLPRPNDGTIAVEETKVPGMKEHVIMHVSHSQMLFSARVAAQIAHFLDHGKFARGPGEQP